MGTECLISKIIDDNNLQKIIWEVYITELGSGIISETAFPQQCFDTFERLIRVLIDENFTKFVLYSEDKKVIGMAIASNNLERVRDEANVKFNPELYKNIYPVLYKKGKIFYFPAMCILSEYQNVGYFSVLADKMITMINEHEGVAAFDYSERKNPNMGELLVYIAKKLKLRPKAEARIIDQQSFVVVG
jgi:hypothetical protein